MLNHSEVIIEKIKFGAQQRFDGSFTDVEIREHLDDTAYVFGEKGQDFVIDYPQDWWQAVKNRFAPRWFLKRWPVLYTRHRISPQTIYKNFKISLPRERHHLRIEHLEYQRVDLSDLVLTDDEFAIYKPSRP